MFGNRISPTLFSEFRRVKRDDAQRTADSNRTRLSVDQARSIQRPADDFITVAARRPQSPARHGEMQRPLSSRKLRHAAEPVWPNVDDRDGIGSPIRDIGILLRRGEHHLARIVRDLTRATTKLQSLQPRELPGGGLEGVSTQRRRELVDHDRLTCRGERQMPRTRPRRTWIAPRRRTPQSPVLVAEEVRVKAICAQIRDHDESAGRVEPDLVDVGHVLTLGHRARARMLDAGGLRADRSVIGQTQRDDGARSVVGDEKMPAARAQGQRARHRAPRRHGVQLCPPRAEDAERMDGAPGQLTHAIYPTTIRTADRFEHPGSSPELARNRSAIKISGRQRPGAAVSLIARDEDPRCRSHLRRLTAGTPRRRRSPPGSPPAGNRPWSSPGRERRTAPDMPGRRPESHGRGSGDGQLL